MANKKVTRRALVMSVVALILCCAMLVGTTFAWFTDSASSAVNTIQSGNLDVDLVYAGTENSAEGKTLNFVDANGKTDILWEPGCTFKLESVEIVNKGNLALKYQLTINGFNGDLKLLEAIEWKINDTTFDITTNLPGNLTPQASKEITISAHMKEDAGNEYQGLTLSGIGITVLATQDTVEYDSYGKDYDAGAQFDANDAAGPAASVNSLGELPNLQIPLYTYSSFQNTGNTHVGLDQGFVFKTTQTPEEAAAGQYKDWHADFVVSFDKDIVTGTAGLAGQYDFWSMDWVGFAAFDVDSSDGIDGIKAGTPCRLLAGKGVTISYEELCQNVKTFNCGIFDVDGANAGTTITVELRLYETNEELGSLSSTGSETGNYITVGTYTHTF